MSLRYEGVVLSPGNNSVILQLVGFFRSKYWETREVCIGYHPMEDLAENESRLSLSKREGPGRRHTKEDSTLDYSIAAKFLTKRALNVNEIARTFRPLWRARNGFQIQNLGNHKFYSPSITKMMLTESS